MKNELTQQYSTSESRTFERKNSSVMERFDIKIKFSKGHRPDKEKFEDVFFIFGGLLIAIQSSTNIKEKNAIKKLMNQHLKEL